MTSRIVNPPQQTAPVKLLQDPAIAPYFQQLDYFLYQIWQRTGAGDDRFTDIEATTIINTSISVSDSPYTVINDFERIFVNASAGNVTINFKAAAEGKYCEVKKIDTTANTVTLSASDNILGESTQVLKYYGESLECVSTGSEWFV